MAILASPLQQLSDMWDNFKARRNKVPFVFQNNQSAPMFPMSGTAPQLPSNPINPQWQNDVIRPLTTPGSTYGNMPWMPYERDKEGKLSFGLPNSVRDLMTGFGEVIGGPQAAYEGRIDPLNMTKEQHGNIMMGLMDFGGASAFAPKPQDVFMTGLDMLKSSKTPSSEASDKVANFKKWFGDSKVVDDTGEPLTAYKGMWPYDVATETATSKGDLIESINRQSEFPAFNKGEEGTDIAGFFSNKPEVAGRFTEGGATYPVNLSMQNPYIIDAKGEHAANFQFYESGKTFRDAIRSGEYDGVIIKNTKDEGDVFVPLNPEQIKSIHNKGTYDPQDPRILYSGGKGTGALNAGAKSLGVLNKRPEADPWALDDATKNWKEGHNGGPPIDDRIAIQLPTVDRDTPLLKRVGDVKRVNETKVEMDIPAERATTKPRAEDLIDRPWHSGMSDTSRGKMERIRSIDGNEVDVTMYGGRDYPLYQDGKAWASAEGPAQGVLNGAIEAEQQAGVRGGSIGIPYQMGAPSPDFATFNTNLMLQHSRSALTNKTKKALDKRIREGVGKGDNSGVPDWPGIDSPDAHKFLEDLGGKRKNVGKAFDEFRGDGTLDISRARAIVTDPNQYNPKLGNLHNLSNYDTSKSIAEGIHPTYTHDVFGSYNSTFDAPVSVFDLNPQSGVGNRKPAIADLQSRGYDMVGRPSKQSPALGKAMMGGLIGKFDQEVIDMLIKKGAIQP